MRWGRVIYVSLVLLAGVGSISTNALPQETGFPVLLAFQAAISALTYPLGIFGTLVGSGLIFSGIVTPLEAILLCTPVFAILGYLQWFWLLPKVYRAKA